MSIDTQSKTNVTTEELAGRYTGRLDFLQSIDGKVSDLTEDDLTGLEALGDQEIVIKACLAGLEKALLGVSHDRSAQEDVTIAPEALDAFGSSLESIPGLEQAIFIEKTARNSTLLEDKDLRKISAFDALLSADRKTEDDYVETYDAFGITINTSGAEEDTRTFRVVDLTSDFSNSAQKPFVAGSDKEKQSAKQRAMLSLVTETRLEAENDYLFNGRAKSVKKVNGIKYLQNGSTRVYFMVLDGAAIDLDTPNPDKTIVYIGTCEKNQEKSLYSSLLNINM